MHLSEQMSHGPESRPDSIEAGAPEAEIEVTPAMIEAGVATRANFDRRFDSDESLVEGIYRAMRAVSDLKRGRRSASSPRSMGQSRNS